MIDPMGSATALESAEFFEQRVKNERAIEAAGSRAVPSHVVEQFGSSAGGEVIMIRGSRYSWTRIAIALRKYAELIDGGHEVFYESKTTPREKTDEDNPV